MCASMISMRGSTCVFCCYFSFRKVWKSASGCGRGYAWSRYESSKLPSSLVLCCTLQYLWFRWTTVNLELCICSVLEAHSVHGKMHPGRCIWLHLLSQSKHSGNRTQRDMQPSSSSVQGSFALVCCGFSYNLHTS